MWSGSVPLHIAYTERFRCRPIMLRRLGEFDFKLASHSVTVPAHESTYVGLSLRDLKTTDRCRKAAARIL
jgi:hypothetical protein